MRTSDYVINVKLPETDEHLLVHGYSGAVDVVKSNVAKFLSESKKPGSAPSVTLSDPAVQILAKRGYLTDKTREQEEKYVCRLAETLHNHLKKSGSSFLIIPTYNCNLRCVYCFEKRLRTNGREWVEKVVDRDAVDTIFQSMVDLKPLKDKSYPIILYGGEPLLARNFDTIKYIVEKAQKGKYSLSAITNGIDLETYLPLLSHGKIKRLQITLDGPPAVHNKRRCGPCGLKSFGIIADNITKARRRVSKSACASTLTRATQITWRSYQI